MSSAPVGILVRFPRPFGADGASARDAHVGAADGYPGCSTACSPPPTPSPGLDR